MPRKINHIDLPEGWEKQILTLYEEGASDTMVKKWIYSVRGKFSAHLWSAWLRENKDFAETIETGRILSQVWWEEKGKGVGDRSFNSVLWYMNMKNRFGWSDDKKDSSPIKVELKVDFVKPK